MPLKNPEPVDRDNILAHRFADIERRLKEIESRLREIAEKVEK